MYKLITGNYTLAVPESPGQYPAQDIILACDTTLAAVNITLPAIAAFGGALSSRIIINDYGNNAAANPITVTCDAADKINNAATLVINENGASSEMIITGLTDWGASNPQGGLPQIARTSTVGGLTTAIIANGNVHVNVTSANAAFFIVLPKAVPGAVVTLNVLANGYELQAFDPATEGINGGVGAGFSSSVGANVFVVCRCNGAGTWIASQYTTAGVESALPAAN